MSYRLTSVIELDESQNPVCVTCAKQIFLCFVYSWIRDSFQLYSSLLLLFISYRGKTSSRSLCLFLVHYYLFTITSFFGPNIFWMLFSSHILCSINVLCDYVNHCPIAKNSSFHRAFPSD